MTKQRNINKKMTNETTTIDLTVAPSVKMDSRRDFPPRLTIILDNP